MGSGTNQLNLGKLLLYGGGGFLLLLIGTLCGMLISGGWQRTANPAPSPIALFITSTPGPSQPTQPTSTPGRPLPDGTFCEAIPADWRSYTIQAGDTLSGLAGEAGVSHQMLLQSNCLASPELLIGQTLFLPPLPTPVPCQPSVPPGWTLYTIQPGETLSNLAAARQITTERVIQTNCLSSTTIVAGQQLYLPSLPTPTPCVTSLPPGWGIYSVQTDETLFSLAQSHKTTVEEIKRVNCLTSDVIQVGQQLYLPLLPTPTPTQTPFPTPIPTAISPPTAIAQAVPGVGQQTPPGSGVTQPGGQAGTAQVEGQVGATQPGSVFSGDSGFFAEKRTAPFGPASKLRQLLIKFSPCIDRDWKEDQPPWTAVFTPTLKYAIDAPYHVVYGERVFSYVCGFTDATELKGWLIGPDHRPRPLEVRLYLLAPTDDRLFEQKIELTQGVVIWNVTCDLPPGEYRLFVENKKKLKSEEVTFKLLEEAEDSKKPHVMVVPLAASIGSNLQVYYCDHPSHTLVEVDLFYESRRERPDLSDINVKSVLDHIGHWTVTTNAKGWTEEILWSSLTDPPGHYRIYTDLSKDDKTYFDFWLLR